MPSILVVDDEPVGLDDLEWVAAKFRGEVHIAGSLAEAQEKLRTHRFDVVVTDLRLVERDMNDVSGLVVLSEAKNKDPYTQVIIVTNYATRDRSVEAMSQGAYDFVDKNAGVDWLDMLRYKIAQAIDYKAGLEQRRSQ